jgi:hypothetical protein
MMGAAQISSSKYKREFDLPPGASQSLIRCLDLGHLARPCYDAGVGGGGWMLKD